jgi:hypothetical protein
MRIQVAAGITRVNIIFISDLYLKGVIVSFFCTFTADNHGIHEFVQHDLIFDS